MEITEESQLAASAPVCLKCLKICREYDSKTEFVACRTNRNGALDLHLKLEGHDVRFSVPSLQNQDRLSEESRKTKMPQDYMRRDIVNMVAHFRGDEPAQVDREVADRRMDRLIGRQRDLKNADQSFEEHVPVPDKETPIDIRSSSAGDSSGPVDSEKVGGGGSEEVRPTPRRRARRRSVVD